MFPCVTLILVIELLKRRTFGTHPLSPVSFLPHKRDRWTDQHFKEGWLLRTRCGVCGRLVGGWNSMWRISLSILISPLLTSSREPPYRPNGSDRLPKPKHPLNLQSCTCAFSPVPPSAAKLSPRSAGKSRPPFAAHPSPPFAGDSRPPSVAKSKLPFAAHASLPPSAAHPSPRSARKSRPPFTAHPSPSALKSPRFPSAPKSPRFSSAPKSPRFPSAPKSPRFPSAPRVLASRAAPSARASRASSSARSSPYFPQGNFWGW